MPGLPQGHSRPRSGPAQGQNLPDQVDLIYIAGLLMRLLEVGQTLVDAVYDNALLTDIKKFVMLGDPLPNEDLVPGTAQLLFTNELDGPVALYVRFENAETGEAAFIYLQKGNGERATAATAMFAAHGEIPEAAILVPPNMEVWVNATGANAALLVSGKLSGFTVELGGRAAIYKGTRR